LQKYKQANPDDKAIATVEYESAKAAYFDQDYNRAILSFQKYLEQYKGNTYSYDAKFYLADAYQRNGNEREALRFYNAVIEDNRSTFVNRALQRVGEIQATNSQFSQAIRTYTKLSRVASNKREQYLGWAGIMEAYFMLGVYDSVSSYAKLILEQGNVNANAENHAYLFLGKSAMQKGDYDKAKEYFNHAIKSAKDKNAVESKYLIALMQYNKKEFKPSLETLFELNRDYSMYEDWVGKSFLLIADNFVELNERFQAKATLQSIIDKSSVPSVVTEAKGKLAKIEEEDRRRSRTEQVIDEEDHMVLFDQLDSLLNKNIDIDDN
jgi:TolA-binding protein